MPCAFTSFEIVCRPAACTWSRHGEIARMPRRAHASMMSGRGNSWPRLLRTVAVLIESQRWSCEKSRIVFLQKAQQDGGVVQVAFTGGAGLAHAPRVNLGKGQLD